jgi:membrane-anchored protein YejM (alkaline phosphatase superfamily)
MFRIHLLITKLSKILLMQCFYVNRVNTPCQDFIKVYRLWFQSQHRPWITGSDVKYTSVKRKKFKSRRVKTLLL